MALGAFGAHALAETLDARGLDRWATASRYLMAAGFGAVLPWLVARPAGTPTSVARLATWSSASLALGGIVFSAALYLLALGAPGLFGAVAPVGGLLMIAGFLALAWVLLRARIAPE